MSLNIKTSDYKELSEGGSMPSPGDHKMMVVDAESALNKAGTGTNIVLTFQITEGDDEGKELKRWYAIDNPNETAVEIAKSHLAEIARAVGVENLEGADQLKNKVFFGRIMTQYDKDTGEARGVEIVNYRSAKEGFKREFKDRMPPIGAKPAPQTKQTKHPLDDLDDEIPFQ